MTMDGTYVEIDGRPAVRFERTYQHSIDRVWAAITEPAELAAWFPSHVAIELVVGGAVEFSGDPHQQSEPGTVLAVDPPRKLAFTWGTDELHFELEPIGDDGCRLALVNVLTERDTAARNGAGWHVCLAELDKRLDGVPSRGPHSEDTLPWRPLYDSYVAAGLPSGAWFPDDVR